MIDSKLQTFLQNIPKVELHIHLEGSIPIEALWKLIEKYNAVSEIGSIKDLRNRFVFKDFPHFIETWIWKDQFLQDYEDFTFVAQEIAGSLVQQNIRYVEMFYSPVRHLSKGLTILGITEAIRKGFDHYADSVTINLIPDLVRDFGPERGLEILDEIKKIKNSGIIGIGLGGSEQKYPPEPYKEVYNTARSYGLKTTAHAGEVCGPASIWGALNILKVDRIGHGSSAIEDPLLVEYLKNNQIPIEMCPGSNIKLGVVDTIKNHPISDFYKKGLNVFVNTDDPLMFNNSLAQEYSGLINEAGFDLSDIRVLSENAINSAWCHESKKKELLNELDQYYIQHSDLK